MKSSPTAVLLVAVALLADCDAYLSEAAIKKTQQMLKTVCLKKTPVDESVLKNVKIGIFADDNNNLKCYFACTFKTMQLINPKGIIEKKPYKDKISTLVPPSMMEILLPVIDECSDKDKGEICQNAYDFIKCAYSVNPESLNLLPV